MSSLLDRLKGWVGVGVRPIPTWYHPDYRLPLTSIAARTGLDPRRSDLAAWYLVQQKVTRTGDLRRPHRVAWADLCRVHDPAYLDRLTRPEALAEIFAVEQWDLPVDAVLQTLRVTCGGTLEAARAAVRRAGPTLNLQGGMHHAAPDRGSGFCPVNDIAVAIGALRAEGFDGQVVVFDLDAHPPDGTAACLAADPKAWIGSLSGADWGPLDGDVDRTVLPEGADDGVYLAALDALLGRAPAADLVFVLAGGDVRAADPLGPLGLTEAGVQARDLAVLRHIDDGASVWLPAGGYGDGAWRVLAGTGLVLAHGRAVPIPAETDPLRLQFARISRELRDEELDGGLLLTEDDLSGLFGMRPRAPLRLLGFYTASGVELALTRYGFIDSLRRLGYDRFSVALDRAGAGDRMRLFAQTAGAPDAAAADHLLVEVVVDRVEEDGRPLLFVHWMTLRHPLASFEGLRSPLPGQEVPGLGMAREATELLRLMARRLDLDGLAVRPAWLHVAYASRHDFRFVDAGDQGRFEALLRDLAEEGGLKRLTEGVANGRVTLDGEPWAWVAGRMETHEGPPDPAWRDAADAARDAARFAWAPEPSPAA